MPTDRTVRPLARHRSHPPVYQKSNPSHKSRCQVVEELGVPMRFVTHISFLEFLHPALGSSFGKESSDPVSFALRLPVLLNRRPGSEQIDPQQSSAFSMLTAEQLLGPLNDIERKYAPVRLEYGLPGGRFYGQFVAGP